MLGRGQGPPAPFPCPNPFCASGILPSLRFGRFLLDEAKHFRAQSRSPTSHAPMVFGTIPECRSVSLRKERSASPDSSRRSTHSATTIFRRSLAITQQVYFPA